MFEHKENTVDEKFQKKILKQLRAIRLGLGLLTMLLLVGFAILGFLLFKTSGLVNDTQKQLETIQSETTSASDLKNKVCDSGLVAGSTLCAN